MIPAEGLRSGKLLLERRAPDVVVVWGGRPKIQKRWHCRCDCGRKTIVPDTNFRRTGRQTRSCGCYERVGSPRYKSDAKIHRPEYSVWRSMNSRCTIPSRKDFKWYGAKGVTVCEAWRNSFGTFIADMGPRPSPHHTIDRFPNPQGNYEPGNCRWATMAEQAKNRNPPRKRKS